MTADTAFPAVAGFFETIETVWHRADQFIDRLDKYESVISNASTRQEFAQRETVALVDYLSAYFATGDSAIAISTSAKS